PLRMVITNTQLLARRYHGLLDAAADECVGYAVEGAKRMQRLILDLLAYSEIGMIRRAFTQVNCEEVLAGALADLRGSITEREAVVTNEPLPTVWGDAGQLRTVFRNLISNGIKFRHEEPPHVHIRAERRDNEWLFSVRDNGKGITPEYAERLFVVFERLHSQERYPKPGVGLAICRKIIEQHGGRIWAESHPGQGTTFRFTLPPPPPPRAPPPPGGGGAPVARLLDAIAPPALAELDDNVGLLVGDPRRTPAWVAVALDAAHALAPGSPLAGRSGGLLVTHHPLPRRPLGRLLEDDPEGGLLAQLLRSGTALYAAHTSFDSAPLGLSHELAVALGLEPSSLRPLVPPGGSGAGFVKLVVYVPRTHSDAVRRALGEAGAGWIGNYSDTAFACPGRGYFRPREGASPFIGTAGQVEEALEDRLETVVPAYRMAEVVARMLEAHPYEEPAYDVYRLESHPTVTRPELMVGLGRVGELPGDPPPGLGAFVCRVEDALGLERGAARVLGEPDGPARRAVRRVAVCPGAGGRYLGAAAAAGAEVYVTGDLTYHQAVEAARLGLVLVDAGHLGTERLFVKTVAERLRAEFRAQGIRLEVIEVQPPSGWRL
ncbi:MAG: Nif3-like dinuclear metal center hexameric protein, partial [Firmicutes bacterium]|nr:Nif3-like dinuclear metal center hexameric protein [Bacillota bacterium]